MKDASSCSAGLYWASRRNPPIDQILGFDSEIFLQNSDLVSRFIAEYPETANRLVSFAGLRNNA